MALSKVKFRREFGPIVTDFKKDKESTKYDACSYVLGGDTTVVYRKAHITPTKLGQFVTLWVRGTDGIIKPYDNKDKFDIVIICCVKGKKKGLFIFPKAVLIEHDIITGNGNEGKRALRVYPPWDKVTSPQAIKTQAWQLKYFTMLK